MKCGSPERTVGRFWLAFWPAVNPGAPQQGENAPLRSELAWLGHESAGLRTELSKPAVGSEISKIKVSGTAKNCRMVMIRSRIF